MSKVLAETHQIDAGSQFDGTVPTTDHDLERGNLIYSSDDGGGLFLLPFVRNEDKTLAASAAGKKSRRIMGLRVKFGSQTSWTLKIVDGPGTETLWLSGTTEDDLIVTDSVELLPDDSLKLVTVGASAAMVAAVLFEVLRSAS